MGIIDRWVLLMIRRALKWRGVMIDVARHVISYEEMKKNSDAMAAVKMNVRHWHLTDDEGCRVESKVVPLLHQKGQMG